jgi:hypothetical protein
MEYYRQPEIGLVIYAVLLQDAIDLNDESRIDKVAATIEKILEDDTACFQSAFKV